MAAQINCMKEEHDTSWQSIGDKRQNGDLPESEPTAKMPYVQHTEEEADSVQQRRLKNRQAAEKSRRKRKEQLENLHNINTRLSQENCKLSATLAGLKEQVQECSETHITLTSKIEQIKLWIARHATMLQLDNMKKQPQDGGAASAHVHSEISGQMQTTTADETLSFAPGKTDTNAPSIKGKSSDKANSVDMVIHKFQAPVAKVPPYNSKRVQMMNQRNTSFPLHRILERSSDTKEKRVIIVSPGQVFVVRNSPVQEVLPLQTTLVRSCNQVISRNAPGVRSFDNGDVIEDVAANAFVADSSKETANEDVAANAFVDDSSKESANEDVATNAFVDDSSKESAIEDVTANAFVDDSSKESAIEDVAANAFVDDSSKESAIEGLLRLRNS